MDYDEHVQSTGLLLHSQRNLEVLPQVWQRYVFPCIHSYQNESCYRQSQKVRWLIVWKVQFFQRQSVQQKGNFRLDGLDCLIPHDCDGWLLQSYQQHHPVQ